MNEDNKKKISCMTCTNLTVYYVGATPRYGCGFAITEGKTEKELKSVSCSDYKEGYRGD